MLVFFIGQNLEFLWNLLSPFCGFSVNLAVCETKSSGHQTHGIESISLLLLPSTAKLVFSGELLPFTLCLISSSSLAPPFTKLPFGSSLSFSAKLLCLGVGVWQPETLDPLHEDFTLSFLVYVGVVLSRVDVRSLEPLGVGILLLLLVTGVETVDNWDIVDFCELRKGEQVDLLASLPEESCSAWK